MSFRSQFAREKLQRPPEGALFCSNAALHTELPIPIRLPLKKLALWWYVRVLGHS